MKTRETLLAIAAAAALAGAGAAPEPARAAGPAAAQPAAAGCVRGRDLMTPAEREAHRTKMRAASPEEKTKLRAEMHAQLAKRAAAKKQTLCGNGPAGGGGPGAGQGRGPGAGRDQGQGAGPGGPPAKP